MVMKRGMVMHPRIAKLPRFPYHMNDLPAPALDSLTLLLAGPHSPVETTMVVANLKLAGLALSLLLGSAIVYQTRAGSPPKQSTETAAGLSADQFDKLRALIKPKPGGF